MLDTLSPTLEQLKVLELLSTTSRNVMVNSFAGTGKTTMLEMIEGTIDEPLLCLAFNKAIAEEMAKRFKEGTEVRTFNSLGHRIWARSCVKNITFTPKKAQNLLAQIIKALPKKSQQSEAWDEYFDIMEACNLARALGYVPEGVFPNAIRLCDWEAVAARCNQTPTETTFRLTNALLTACIRASYEGNIDFSDQIYMPALFGGAFPKFPFVMVDETQDLSPTNHQMLNKLVKGRLASVGDPYQSIYQFRGAEMDGMARSAVHFNMLQTDLSISFRCPEAIVRNVHWRVPTFKWLNVGGEVKRLDEMEIAAFPDECAILCRNNAPLFKLAFRLIGEGRAVSVAGNDMGPRLLGVMKKLGDTGMRKAQVLSKIDNWLMEKLNKDNKTAIDMAEAMKIFAGYGSTLGEAIAYAEHLFNQQGTIVLLTGHKAKGLEFDTVFHLDNFLIRQGEQEDNLRYVIDTRARKALFYINSQAII
jgi:superfamily I DNA/RNA helicase